MNPDIDDETLQKQQAEDAEARFFISCAIRVGEFLIMAALLLYLVTHRG